MSLLYLLLGELSRPSRGLGSAAQLVREDSWTPSVSKVGRKTLPPVRHTQWGSLPNRKAVWTLDSAPKYLMLRDMEGLQQEQ